MPRVPRLSPKAERKVLSARSYLSLSVVAVASGHDQSEVSIPGYQSAPSAYIIVRSLGHCLSTVVNHILFPRLRFRFIYLSEKRIATVLVANSRAPTRTRAYTRARPHVSVRGQTRARARLCRWTHVQNRETRILQRVCENANEYGERKREREREQCAPSWLRLLTAERVRGKGARGPQRTTSIFIKHPSPTVVDDCLTKFHR